MGTIYGVAALWSPPGQAERAEPGGRRISGRGDVSHFFNTQMVLDLNEYYCLISSELVLNTDTTVSAGRSVCLSVSSVSGLVLGINSRERERAVVVCARVEAANRPPQTGP
ncbi:unnamed protein product [Spodoptera exigua]|nr:unnamed protein product [Spodoptera exigua]